MQKLAICSSALFLMIPLMLVLGLGDFVDLFVYTGMHWLSAGLAIGSLLYERGIIGKVCASFALTGSLCIAVLLFID